MATERVGESRDVGPLLHRERQVLEMTSAGAPLAAAPDRRFRRISPRSDFMSPVFLVNGRGKRLTRAAGQHLPDVWRRPTGSFFLTSTTGFRRTAVDKREKEATQPVFSPPP